MAAWAPWFAAPAPAATGSGTRHNDGTSIAAETWPDCSTSSAHRGAVRCHVPSLTRARSRSSSASPWQGIAEGAQGAQGLDVLGVLAGAPLVRCGVLRADQDLGPGSGVGAAVEVASAPSDLVLQVAAAILGHLEAALARAGIAQKPGQLGAAPGTCIPARRLGDSPPVAPARRR